MTRKTCLMLALLLVLFVAGMALILAGQPPLGVYPYPGG